MNLQFDPVSSQFNFLRSLGSSLLAGSEELISWQIDSTQAFVTRSSQQLKATLSGMAAAQKAENPQDAWQSLMHNTLEMTRDTLLASTDYQMESMRLLQKHGTESQKALAEAVHEQFAKIGADGQSEPSRSPKRRLAA
ncbi:MAG: hypothetical protein WAV95_04280 [Azonexus sp.]